MATATVRGDQLVVAVEQSETCATITTQRAHRLKSVTRIADPKVVRTTWLVATVALGAGVYSYSNAGALAAEANAGNTEGAATAGEYRVYGMGLGLLGLGAAALAAIDSLRATDYVQDEGIIDGESERIEDSCRYRKTQNKNAVLTVGNGYQVAARVDQDGRAAFTLLSVPEAGIPDEQTALVASIGEARVGVDLSPEQRASLRAALLANPRSRIAMDLFAKRQAACAQLVLTAQTATRDRLGDDPEVVHVAWSAAKSACDDLWTHDIFAEFTEVEGRIEVARCDQRVVRAASALNSELQAWTVDEAKEELVSLRAACPSATHVEQVQRLEVRLAAVVKRIAREEADLARRIAREEAEVARRIAREEARALREAQQRRQRSAPVQRSWGSGMLRCNDGTLSPTCSCGRSSNRGCCSHHGGVSGCSQ